MLNEDQTDFYNKFHIDKNMEEYISNKIVNSKDATFLILLKDVNKEQVIISFEKYKNYAASYFEVNNISFFDRFSMEDLYKVYISNEVCLALKSTPSLKLKLLFGYVENIKESKIKHDIVFDIMVHWLNFIDFKQSQELLIYIKFIISGLFVDILQRNLEQMDQKKKCINHLDDSSEINKLIRKVSSLTYEVKDLTQTYESFVSNMKESIRFYRTMISDYETKIKNYEQKNLELTQNIKETHKLYENVPDLNNKLLCSVCLTGLTCMIGENCKHLSCCFPCSSKLEKCPICRNQTEFYRIYFN